ncbi:surface lipoprotein assembly modifier [Puniceibacterium sediminis]|uniref:Tetratricopeptide repeat-containing protein n=1 Tax=Puniceibacterium sediminis TaxID=1608407 RepID=A0A238ZZX1_9RHOB|nr:surface lipoprotein assembly modifier [Puniceibacterium sediminis]SNR88935.1 Tetratricopeptide repeat-containing protein [Puniceibacterium sediminis]
MALRQLLVRPFIALFFLLWIAGLCLPDLAAARGSKDIEILQLINDGRYDAARELLSAQTPSDADRAFAEARILKVQRRLREAINAFRLTLQIDPNYIEARRELAHTLLLNQQYDAAEFHFKALLDIESNESLREGYRRFLIVIDRNKPMGVTGHFSLIPSTNINRGTTQTLFDTTSGVFVIDSDSRASSGVGTQLGISGYFRNRTGPNSRVTLNWRLVGTHYEDTIHDNATGAVSLTYERVSEAWQWYVSPFFSLTWREDDADFDTKGARVGLTRPLSNKYTLYLSGSHEYRNYQNQVYKNGDYSLISLSLSRQINPSLMLNGGLAFEFNNTAAPHLRYYGRKVFAGISKSWQGGLQTSSSAEFGSRNFVGDFPVLASPRDDTYHALSFGVSNTRIEFGGFTPRLSCSYTTNESNVVFYEYKSTECLVSISKNF